MASLPVKKRRVATPAHRAPTDEAKILYRLEPARVPLQGKPDHNLARPHQGGTDVLPHLPLRIESWVGQLEAENVPQAWADVHEFYLSSVVRRRAIQSQKSDHLRTANAQAVQVELPRFLLVSAVLLNLCCVCCHCFTPLYNNAFTT